MKKLKKLNAKGLSHHLLIALLVISGIAGFGAWRVFTSSAAVTAGTLCGQAYDRIHTGDIKRDGKVVGTLSVMKHGSKYCAVLMSKGSLSGVNKWMTVVLGHANSCRNQSDTGLTEGGGGAYPLQSVSDPGDYEDYAGPVKKDLAGKNCIYALSQMKIPGTNKYGYAWITKRI